MLILRPVRAEDAEGLFPLVYRSPVIETILWEGPTSLEEFQQNLTERAVQVSQGQKHFFTMIETDSNMPLGSIDIRPEENGFRADIGLWIGKPYHGLGYGTRSVRWITAYGFEVLNLDKIDAYVFLGNWASRRIFEKNGFLLEGIIRNAERKRGQLVDIWAFGITRTDYLPAAASPAWLVHICTRSDWQAALALGFYHPPSLAEFGFIHCSLPGQVVNVVNTFYRDVPDLILLWIHPHLAMAEIRWEPVDGESFPHLYGLLNTTAVLGVSPLVRESDGVLRVLPSPPDGFD